jgi:DNA (cytosine-5)-methyltransferase 1
VDRQGRATINDEARENHKIRLGELFCGPGGIARAAMSTTLSSNEIEYGFSHVWANDINPTTCETFRRNIDIDPDQVYAEPVSDFIERVDDLEPIDLLAFGFPCNDFSQVGEQRGLTGKFGPLYTYGVHMLKTFQPSMFLAENVGGIQSANGGNAFIQILSELKECGYEVTAHLWKFEEYGVPQARHRVVIVGVNRDKHPGVRFNVPKPTTPGSLMRTCKEALTLPPIPPTAPNQELTRQSQTVISRLKYIKPGENAWTAAIPDELKLHVKGAFISQIYRRLDPSRPAYTITGSGGGGTHVYHWEEDRALTNRERARLQTFPDDFEFMGSKEQVRGQIGMAVPVTGAAQILSAILKTLAGVEYDSVKSGISTENLQLDLSR